MSLGAAAREANWKLLGELRAAGICADMDFGDRSAKSQFKVADREMATHAITVGENELAQGNVVMKTLATGEQVTLGRSEIVARLKDLAAHK